MERRKFFKILAGAIGASVVATCVLGKEDVFTEEDFDDACKRLNIDPEGVSIDVSKIPSHYTVADVLYYWKNFGILIYQS